MDGKRRHRLADKRIAWSFSGTLWAEEWSPTASIEQAVDLRQAPCAMICEWRHRALLGQPCRGAGQGVRVFHERLLQPGAPGEISRLTRPSSAYPPALLQFLSPDPVNAQGDCPAIGRACRPGHQGLYSHIAHWAFKPAMARLQGGKFQVFDR